MVINQLNAVSQAMPKSFRGTGNSSATANHHLFFRDSLESTSSATLTLIHN